MDEGYTIVGLNEGWTLGGARMMEWVSGFVMAMITQELLHIKISTSGPLMIVVVLLTALSLAALRKQFPDEERGLRNAAMVALGFEPPGIPSPASFKPYWSGAPVRELPETSYFKSLQLEVLFATDSRLADPFNRSPRLSKASRGEDSQQSSKGFAKNRGGSQS